MGRHPCRSPCGLILHPPAAAEGTRVKQRAIVARTFQKSHSRARAKSKARATATSAHGSRLAQGSSSNEGVANFGGEVSLVDEQVAELGGGVANPGREVRNGDGDVANLDEGARNPGRHVPNLGVDVAKPGVEVRNPDEDVDAVDVDPANRGIDVTQVSLDRQSPGGAVGDHTVGSRGSRGRLERLLCLGWVGEQIEQHQDARHRRQADELPSTAAVRVSGRRSARPASPSRAPGTAAKPLR